MFFGRRHKATRRARVTGVPDVTGSASFRLLLIADTHYAPPGPQRPDTPPQRLTRLGCELARRTVEDARRRGGFDAVALLGDMLNDGAAPGAAGAAAQVIAAVRDAARDKPLLIVPGNHDYADGHLPDCLTGHDGVNEIGGYRFVTFADPYAETMYCTRREEDRRRLADLARGGGSPLVVLQHNPISPYIDSSSYPFMLTNRAEVLADYAEAGVMLSISGHYHAGQPLTRENGVTYFTAPAVCESPMRYAVLTLSGRDVQAELRQLHLSDAPPLWDTHAHTEFAYCGRGISAAQQIDRAQTFGLSGLCLVEHAPQLYCCADDFWAARHIRETGCWRKEAGRIAEFRAAMEPLRGPGVRIGMEVEADADGELTIRDEDRQWVDLLVGAVHWLPREAEGMSPGEFAAEFMKTCEALLVGGVHVLAHPLRIVRAWKFVPDAQIHRDLADLLAAHGAAAEINMHINRPDASFFAECIQRGVKITFGSDAHQIYESAAFHPNLDLLRRAAGRDDIADLLYYPK